MNRKSQHTLFILDRSGSMASRASDVIGGFNTYISEMSAEAAKDGLATLVSLVTFADDHAIVFAAKPVGEVEPLEASSYRPMGSTALLDAVHDTATKYREKIGEGAFGSSSADAPPVLVIVFTDGCENASQHTTWEQVQQLIQACEKLGNWTFAYVGAHAGAWSQSEQLHFKAGNTLDAQHMSVHEATTHLIQGYKKYRTAYRDLDKKASVDLFATEPDPDASAVGS